MFTTIVKTVKAAVLASIATELAFDAAFAIRDWMQCRKEARAWDEYVENSAPVEYNPVTHVVK